jgi:hypothetical protein
MTSLILEKLEETVGRFRSKLAIISDLAGLYLDKDVPVREAKEVFNQLTLHLSKLAEEKRIIVLCTCLPHHDSRRGSFFKAVACGRANVVLSVKPSKFGQQLFLEKHPALPLGYADFSSEDYTLDRFLEDGEWGKRLNPIELR